MACKSVPEQAVVAAGRGAAVTKVWAEAEVVTVVVEEQAGLQLLAQFWSIHEADRPVHCPCDAQVAHVACESVPEHEVVVVGRRGAAVALEKVGGAVTGRGAAVAAVVAEHQLLAQFAAIHAADVPVHCPCDAQVAHVACIVEAIFWHRSTSSTSTHCHNPSPQRANMVLTGVRVLKPACRCQNRPMCWSEWSDEKPEMARGGERTM